MSHLTIQQLHETVPSLREMMYGKDKARYAPVSFSKNMRRQRLLKELKTLVDEKANEYLKFTKDIRSYDFSKPLDVNILKNLDFEDMAQSIMKYGTYLCYDDSFGIGGQYYKIYIVNYKSKHFICVYKFGRYYDDCLKHPSTKLQLCMSFRP